MVKKNKSSKKVSKNSIKKAYKKGMVKNICSSIYLLYFIVIVSLLNVFVLLLNQENESVFLFIIIASLIYMNNKNLIFVLGIPFIVVNILKYLKKIFNRNNIHEGFAPGNPEVYTKPLFQKFIKTRFNTDKSYQDYTMTLEGLTPISDLIQNVLNNSDDEESFDDTPIIELEDYLEFMDSITEDDDLFKNNQVKYSKNLIKDYKVYEGELLKQMNTATDSMKKTEDDAKTSDATPSTDTTATPDATPSMDATATQDSGKEDVGKEEFVTQKDIKKFVDGINSFMSKTK